MSSTSILFIVVLLILVVVFLVYRIIDALHRIASRIESSNTHLDELKIEVSALAEELRDSFIRMNSKQNDVISSIEDIENEIQNENFYGNGEETYEQAKELVMEEGKASASLIQRRLEVGYARAARILDQLEERGVVGPPDGSRPRQVL